MKATVLARAIGVSRTAVHNWEQGRDEPSEENLSKLAAALRTTPDALRSGSHMTTTPTGAEPAGAGVTPQEAARRGPRRSADYWEGVQYAVQRMLEQILSIQREATDLHRELVANTVPAPRKHPQGKPAPVGVAQRRPKGAAKKGAAKRRSTG